MATIDLNNLIRPKKVNNTTTTSTLQVKNVNPVYVDLHLDLTLENNIGLGNNPVESRDILVDTDIQAIKNSIRNIFTTKKGIDTSIFSIVNLESNPTSSLDLLSRPYIKFKLV
jgi:hypothetical protein